MAPDRLRADFPFQLYDFGVLPKLNDGSDCLNDLNIKFGSELVTLDQHNAGSQHQLEVDFEIPALDDGPTGDCDATCEDITGSLSNFAPAEAASASEGDPTESANIWTLDAQLHDQRQRLPLRSWDGFEYSHESILGSAYGISEASHVEVDGFLASISLEEKHKGVLPQNVVFSALRNLVLGRSSIFFQWNHTVSKFEQTLHGVPASGHCLSCYNEFLASVMAQGSLHRKLREFSCTSIYTKTSSAAIAFQQCIANILDELEKYFTDQLPVVRSFLQIQNLIQHPREVLLLLQTVSEGVNQETTDEVLISALSDVTFQLASTGNAWSVCFRDILERVSLPWLERLYSDLYDAIEHNVDIAAETVTTSPSSSLDGNQSISVTRAKDDVGVIDESLRAIIANMRTSLQVLRQHEQTKHVGARHFPSDEFTRYKATDSVRVDFCASAPKSISVQTREKATTNAFAVKVTGATPRATGAVQDVALLSSEDTNEEIHYLVPLNHCMSEQIEDNDPTQLHCVVRSALHERHSHSNYNRFVPVDRFELDPLHNARRFLETEAIRVNRALVRCLFKDCRLRLHLDALQQFYLFGNPTYVELLGSRLFREDHESAVNDRRKAGTPRTGLHLGVEERSQWPPPSSQVQLSLMNIMNDTYVPKHRTPSDSKELPGGLSFAIRELPESEIDKVSDSQSVHALDFLKIQYQPPAPLDKIITARSLETYDVIFRFLLKLLRVLDTIRALKRICYRRGAMIANYNNRKERQIQRFANEAHHFTTVLAAYCFDIGVSVPLNTLGNAMRGVEEKVDCANALQAEAAGSSPGIDELFELHDTCLNTMRNRLFLRQKHIKIQAHIEILLASILQYASAVDANDDTRMVTCAAQFQQTARGFVQDASISVRRTTESSPTVDLYNDNEAILLLFSKLQYDAI